MNIAVCDDHDECRKNLATLLDRYVESRHRAISVAVYDRGSDLLEEAQRIGGFDLYILDVLMPRLNGIELGRQLRASNFDGKILYLTASEEYAIDAFRVNAFGYLLKPVKEEELFGLLDAVVASVSSRRDKGTIVKSKDSSVKLSFDSILYAELERKKVVYHLVNGRTVEGTAIRIGFSDAVQQLLQDKRFALCGASMVVNLHYITAVGADSLLFTNGLQLYIGKRASRDLRSVWSDYWFNGEEN